MKLPSFRSIGIVIFFSMCVCFGYSSVKFLLDNQYMTFLAAFFTGVAAVAWGFIVKEKQ